MYVCMYMYIYIYIYRYIHTHLAREATHRVLHMAIIVIIMVIVLLFLLSSLFILSLLLSSLLLLLLLLYLLLITIIAIITEHAEGHAPRAPHGGRRRHPGRERPAPGVRHIVARSCAARPRWSARSLVARAVAPPGLHSAVASCDLGSSRGGASARLSRLPRHAGAATRGGGNFLLPFLFISVFFFMPSEQISHKQ